MSPILLSRNEMLQTQKNVLASTNYSVAGLLFFSFSLYKKYFFFGQIIWCSEFEHQNIIFDMY